jgi:cysteine sulfinate desulfinase/cysteine desulfurase-like protein
MGLSDEDIFSSVRFSLGKYTTENEINETIEKFKKIIDNNKLN